MLRLPKKRIKWLSMHLKAIYDSVEESESKDYEHYRIVKEIRKVLKDL